MKTIVALGLQIHSRIHIEMENLEFKDILFRLNFLLRTWFIDRF